MELLLAVAVMSVAVASWIIATTFRIRIRENSSQLTQATEQIARCAAGLQQAEKRLRTQSDHDQARWADDFETVRHQIGEAQVHLARHDEELRQHQDRLGDPGTDTDQLGTARQDIQQLQRAIRDLGSRAAHAEQAAGKAQELREGVTADMADLRREAELQLASVAGEVSRLSRHLRGIQQYVRAQLDHEVTATRGNPARRVLAGGIYAEQPAALDILPLMYASFLRELPAHMLFHDPADQCGSRSYLSWTAVNGQSLEQRLGTLLRACAGGESAPARGLAELRGLLLTLHNAGPGTLQVGPLVVFRTSDQLAGAVLDDTEAGLLDSQPAVPAPKECRALLSTLGPGRLTDLGAWADSQSASQ